MPISEIKVTFENGVKKEEYGAIKKASVTLTAVVPEGVQAIDEAAGLLEVVAQLAQDKVNEMLNLQPTAEQRFAAAKAVGAAAMLVDAPAEPAKRTRAAAKPKDEPAADPAAVVDDASVIDTETLHPKLAEVAAALDPSAVTDDWSTDPAGEEVTDADLNAACQKGAGEGLNPVDIKRLIASYNPDKTKVFQLREIAQAQRADFLTRLANKDFPAAT